MKIQGKTIWKIIEISTYLIIAGMSLRKIALKFKAMRTGDLDMYLNGNTSNTIIASNKCEPATDNRRGSFR